MSDNKQKLNSLLSKTDQLSAVVKKNMTDAISTFGSKQGIFVGEKTVYTPRSTEYADTTKSVDRPVGSTVIEWLNYFSEEAAAYLAAKLNQESTNCSGTAKAELKVGDVSFGVLTSGELLALKGFFESTALRDMFEKMPTLTLSERWTKSNSAEYSTRAVMETPVVSWVDKESVTTPKVEWDPLGKQPGIITNIKTTVDKGDVTRQTFSGAISHTDRAAILKRLTDINVAIKAALEVANSVEVVDSNARIKDLLSFLKG